MKKYIFIIFLNILFCRMLHAQKDTAKFNFGAAVSANGNYFGSPSNYYAKQYKGQYLSSHQFVKTLKIDLVSSFKYFEFSAGTTFGCWDSVFNNLYSGNANESFIKVEKYGVLGINGSLKIYFDMNEKPLCPYFSVGADHLSFKYNDIKSLDVYPDITLYAHSLWRYHNDQIFLGLGTNCKIFKNLFMNLDVNITDNFHTCYILENPPSSLENKDHYHYNSIGIYFKGGLLYNFYKI